MQRFKARTVENLLAAGSAGSRDKGLSRAFRGLSHRREENHLPDGHRGLVVLLFVAERARHAAAAAGDDMDPRAGDEPQHLRRCAYADERFLVAVSMEPDIGVDMLESICADAPVPRFPHQEFVKEQTVRGKFLFAYPVLS